VTVDPLTEKVAISMALGNNGGGWATHYTEEQKKVWYSRARSVINFVRDELKNTANGCE